MGISFINKASYALVLCVRLKGSTQSLDLGRNPKERKASTSDVVVETILVVLLAV